MKSLKLAFAVVSAMVFGQAQALHSGGVAHCDACHTMHNSSASATVRISNTPPQMTMNNLGVGTTNRYLLQGADASSTCLNCHSSTSASGYRVYDRSTAGVTVNPLTTNYTPGGDFVQADVNQRTGHNVVAAAFPTLAADSRAKPPGYTGAWDGADFSCVSCHDPHGQSRYVGSDDLDRPSGANALLPIAGSGSYANVTTGTPTYSYDSAAGHTAGAYRILGGNGWKPVNSTQPAITADPPIALAPSTYNKSETGFTGAGGTGQTVVAYVKGMSEWCGTCHPLMHQNATVNGPGNNFRHPSGDNISAALAANYNKYVKTGDWTGTQAYDAFVPVELTSLTRDLAAAKVVQTTGTVDITVGTGDTVMCLTCHRAHASGFQSMMRWDYPEEFAFERAIAEATPGVYTAANYMRPVATTYGEYQRSLCNKCHAKD